MTKFSWLFMLVTEFVPDLYVTVMLPTTLPMKTWSAGPGTTPVFQ